MDCVLTPATTIAKILPFAASVRAMGPAERDESAGRTRGKPDNEHEGLQPTRQVQ